MIGDGAPAPLTTAERRLRRELRTVDAMIAMHCRARHRRPPAACLDCHHLRAYVRLRVDRCPFQATKPTCARCTVHCYRPDMRDRIREVMRYAGPRMPWRHPLLAVLHALDGRRPAPRRRPG